MNLSIADFYRICRNGVRLFPAESPVKTCAQLQTFRVLQRDPRMNAEIGTETLGAVPNDKNLPFFWSREWIQSKSAAGALSYKYPLMTAFEMSNEATGIMAGQISRKYSIELAVLDTFKPEPKSSKISLCDGRPINQIFLDTELMLDSILNYIGGTVIATTIDEPVEMVYNIDTLLATYAANEFSVKQEIGKVWMSENKTMSFTRVEFPTKQIFGTKTRFVFTAKNCPTVSFKTATTEFGAIGFESGCTDC